MKCGTPVIGKVPNMVPEWLTEENGIWTYEGHRLAEFAVNYIEGWLEDRIPEKLLKAMEPVAAKYKKKIKLEEFWRSLVVILKVEKLE